MAQLLALQRSAGNAAVQRALLQRYQFHVIQEKRELTYTDDYDPQGKPNLKHVKGELTGKDAVYESDEGHGAKYGLKHAKEHKQLIDLTQEIIDVLIRRADMAINSGHEAYMIGVMDRSDAVARESGKITAVSAATSGDHPQAFTETLQAIAQLHGEIKLEAVPEILPMPVVKEVFKEQIKSKDVELTGGKTKGSDKIDESKQTLKACAAKKLTFAVRPPIGVNMTEILYDPLGTSPVRIPDNEKGIRYHHRQRVPSCEDCMKNLPHVHQAVTQRIAEIKGALLNHVGGSSQPSVASAEPSSSKPLKIPAKVAPPPWEPVPIAPDKQLAEWAQTAVRELPPRQAQDTLTSRQRDAEELRKKDKREPFEEEQLKRLDAEAKELAGLWDELARLRAAFEKLKGGLTNVIGPVRTLLLDEFRAAKTWPKDKPIPPEAGREITRELDQTAAPLLTLLDPIESRLAELDVSPFTDPVQLSWGVTSIKKALERARSEIEGGAARKALEQMKATLEQRKAKASGPTLKGDVAPEAFIAAHASWKNVPVCSAIVDLEIQPDGRTELGKAFEKSLSFQIKETATLAQVKAAIEAIVKDMIWQPVAKTTRTKVRFEKK